jgi:A/G-specific adenine glycosylase
VDGNVTRVLSRYFGISTPIDTTAGKKEYAGNLAEMLLDKNQQAFTTRLLWISALPCLHAAKPALRLMCAPTPDCQAWQKGLTGQLPVKEKSITQKTAMPVLFYRRNARRQSLYPPAERAKTSGQGLYEFILFETDLNPFGLQRYPGIRICLGNSLKGRHSQPGISPAPINRN